MMTKPALCSALPEGFVPNWVHLLPSGEVRTNDGRGPYRVRDAQALIANSIALGKLPLDENHSTDLAAPNGEPAPARGWIVELQSRADGIWGRVEWTGTGRRIMTDRQYRGISPVIRHSNDGGISAILRASLTNTPNLTGLRSLHSALPIAPPSEARTIMQKAREIQATFERAGLPIDLASAINSAMEEVSSAPTDRHDTSPDDLSDGDLEMIRKLGLNREAYANVLNPPQPQDGLDAADLDMIRMLGVDRAAYAAQRPIVGGEDVPS